MLDRMDIMQRVKLPPAYSDSDQPPRETGDDGMKLRRVCGAFLFPLHAQAFASANGNDFDTKRTNI